MKKTLPSSPPLLAAASRAAALADEASSPQKNGCLACHAVDKKVVGPVVQGSRRQVPRRQGRRGEAR